VPVTNLNPPNPNLFDIEPFAVRAKIGAQLAGCCLAEFYKRLNAGEYETFLDGAARMITVRSIRARQERLLAETPGTPRERPSPRAPSLDASRKGARTLRKSRKPQTPE
jgi:hypothetical protein